MFRTDKWYCFYLAHLGYGCCLCDIVIAFLDCYQLKMMSLKLFPSEIYLLPKIYLLVRLGHLFFAICASLISFR